MSLPLRPEVQALVRVRPVVEWFASAQSPLPDAGVTFIRETYPASSEDITPRSSLLRTHASQQGLVATCEDSTEDKSRSSGEPHEIATGILPMLSLQILPQMPEPIPRRFAECVCLVLPSIHRPSPSFDWVSFPLPSVNTTFHGSAFEVAAISLMFWPPSLLASQIVPTAVFIAQGSRGFYIRAERAALLSHASDMLSARQQAISGTRNFISQDLHLVGCYRIKSPRLGDSSVLIADATKAQNILRWTTRQSDLSTIVRSAWNWGLQRPEGYERA